MDEPDAAWAQRLVLHLADERDRALARSHRLSGAPILPPRFPRLDRRSCFRCGKQHATWPACPKCGGEMVGVVA